MAASAWIIGWVSLLIYRSVTIMEKSGEWALAGEEM
jgi:hypothetical protein